MAVLIITLQKVHWRWARKGVGEALLGWAEQRWRGEGPGAGGAGGCRAPGRPRGPRGPAGHPGGHPPRQRALTPPGGASVGGPGRFSGRTSSLAQSGPAQRATTSNSAPCAHAPAPARLIITQVRCPLVTQARFTAEIGNIETPQATALHRAGCTIPRSW